MTPAIDVRALDYHFVEGASVLRNVSFTVAPGERVALLGPNGAGKSTLLLHLAGLLPEGDAHGAGTVGIHGLRADTVAARRKIGLLFQDPDDQLFCSTVGEDVAFGAVGAGLAGAALGTRVAHCLARVGLEGFERRAPHRLSGGEKKRVALAGLLAYEPDVLVFDEPTSGLDPRARRRLVDLIVTLEATCLFATHDLAFAAETCQRAIVLDEGVIVADGRVREILADDDLMAGHGLEHPRRDLPAHLFEGDG